MAAIRAEGGVAAEVVACLEGDQFTPLQGQAHKAIAPLLLADADPALVVQVDQAIAKQGRAGGIRIGADPPRRGGLSGVPEIQQPEGAAALADEHHA